MNTKGINTSKNRGFPLHSTFFGIGLLTLLILGTSCGSTPSNTQPVMLELKGNLGVHDPVLIKEGDIYYLFCTGSNRRVGYTPIRCSKDLRTWTLCGHVFTALPEWAPIEIPGTRGIWAPDISFFNGKYHLYYSISTFGKNNSAIGLATNKTLDPNSPNYKWEDQGMVLRSTAGVDDWNAIDANIVIEDEKNVWICWGITPCPAVPARRSTRLRRWRAPSKPRLSFATKTGGTCLYLLTSAAAVPTAPTISLSAGPKRSPGHMWTGTEYR
jgi:hypothetical protein